MDYLLSFLEGIITFISPCLLPMLPVYLTYFAGKGSSGDKKMALRNALGFVAGFSLVFVSMGAFAGTLGSILSTHKTAVNIVSGSLMIVFGLNFIGILRIPFLNANHQFKLEKIQTGFVSSVLFGLVFAVGWTPCVGAFLGSALMMAASSGESIKGILMLLSFSLGLGVPFLASAILIDQLKSTFDFIKRHYRVVNLISGGLLIVVGLMMVTGLFGYFLAIFTN